MTDEEMAKIVFELLPSTLSSLARWFGIVLFHVESPYILQSRFIHS